MGLGENTIGCPGCVFCEGSSVRGNGATEQEAVMDQQKGVGEVVIYVDRVGREYKALVTAVWGEWKADPPPSLNVVFVSNDPEKDDPYGRQIERETSIVHVSQQGAPGFMYRYLDE